ncbi:MAG: NAD(P)-dependent oxidoreductase [Candidatus Omnitrophota bacterium]
MNILVVGAAGFLGKELCRDFASLGKVTAADKYEGVPGLHFLDLARKELIHETFARLKPELVLLTAAISWVDFCETNRDQAWLVNTEGPKEVARACKKYSSFLVFYSSDYVFDGASGPYDEEARPHPINVYGSSKLEAEKAVCAELSRYLIIRTCGIYGYEKGGKNYAMQVSESLRDKKPVQAVNDQYGTPVYVDDLSRASLELINGKKCGLYNIVGPDYLNRVCFAEEIADVFGFDKGLISPIATETLRQPAPRPRKGGLKADKLIAELNFRQRSLREGLLAMKAKIAADC